MSKLLFEYEMMDTPNLANECHRLKRAIDEQAELIRLTHCDVSYKRQLMAQLKLAKSVLKSRQMRMF